MKLADTMATPTERLIAEHRNEIVEVARGLIELLGDWALGPGKQYSNDPSGATPLAVRSREVPDRRWIAYCTADSEFGTPDQVPVISEFLEGAPHLVSTAIKTLSHRMFRAGGRRMQLARRVDADLLPEDSERERLRIHGLIRASGKSDIVSLAADIRAALEVRGQIDEYEAVNTAAMDKLASTGNTFDEPLI